MSKNTRAFNKRERTILADLIGIIRINFVLIALNIVK